MDSSRVDHALTTVITLAGEVRADDVPRLRAALTDALEDGERDVFLDARALQSFADAATPALVGGLSRAKARRHRLVVVDAADGALATSLRRTGLLFKLPVYADAEAAQAGVGEVREAVRRRSRVAAAD